MFTVLIILSSLIGILILIALFGMTQPKITRLERSVIINAPSTTVYPEVSLLRNFVTWNAWSDKDPNMQQVFSDTDGETGSWYTWKGNKKVGEGKMEITGIEPGSLVVLSINFGHRGNATSAFVIEDLGEKTKLTWQFESEMGNALMRGLMSKMMASFIGKDYESGLANLKKKLEA